MDNSSLSNKNYENMVNLTPELLCITNMEGVFKYVNPAFENVIGYSSEEIVGLTLHVFLHDEDVIAIKNTMQTLFNEKNDSSSFELHHRCKDGTYKWLSWNTRVDWTEGLVYSAGRDITEKRKMEQDCLKLRERLLEAQEFAQLGYWEFDTMTGDCLWSDEMFRIGGFEPQEFIPTINDFLLSIHPDDKEFVINIMQVLLNGSECEFDFRLIRQDNEIIWVHEKVRHEFDASGLPVRSYGVIQDITQRKLSELKLKESEEKFKELAENLGEVIYIQQNGQFVYISSAYERVTGKTCQSMYENPLSYIDSIHPEDKDRIVKVRLEDKYISKGLFDEQYRIIQPDGNIRWVWTRSFPIRDENGEIIKRVGIANNITKLKEYEESLREAMEKAEASNKTKSQFLANMSHEIRTPMNGILGMAQLLVMNLKDEEKEMATIIKASGDDLLKIIDDILDLSRIEAGKLRLSQEEFDINMLVNHVNKVMETLVKQKGISYKSYIERTIVNRLIGDPDRLKQVLFNLLGNAIKFTEQGSIELSIAKGKVFEDKLQLVFSVNDSGIGIADDKVGQLFTYFTQGDDSVTKKYGGTGLGLAISKQLINMMDGEISVESKLGVGSCFSFSAIFKAAMDNTEINNTNNEDTLNVTATSSTALLVEDDYVSGVVMKKLCERRNIALTIVTNGKQAIEIMKKECFDIIFMDIQMPDISGYETTRIIRDMEREVNKHTPIIATTAFALVGDREKCIDVGMDDYLAKPIDSEKFYAIVERWSKGKT
ncbi:PAS domain-containing protein [Desulfosporosinus hippei]|uniref:Circadian input-output histidine kinase CikA n=1 Tax=Desulfosporosinus hippei DSM 8344 TaxID=1121419 RepID=A0A1G7TL71_9FIRM|nr:PAS domain-containing protein [Desulfosporosinus hippei]SDG35260.1 PAS domain S-box-containing protein [Desulfosporosinus hippei DSM 8344]